MFKDEVGRKLNVAGKIFPFTLNMLSRNKTVICGVKRVSSSSENLVNIRLDGGSMSVSGVGLRIVEIGGGDMFLDGEITKIEFED